VILNSFRRVGVLTALLMCAATHPLGAQQPLTIIANNNRSPAGELRGDVLSLHLEVSEGQWHPGSDDGEALRVYAFGETGRSLENPGPLIRVRQTTVIQATLHNALNVAVAIHGLHERPGEDKDALLLEPGATQQVRFKAGSPGTYCYWGTTTGSPILKRQTVESQLAGALVIDPPEADGNDRIFVIGLSDVDPVDFRLPATINGKSWPFSERFTFKVGETVHWRWLNPTISDHAMHLHGFYYRLDAIGDGERVEAYSKDARPMVVTQFVRPGETFDMTWVPERPGRWLFHCHMLSHMSPPKLEGAVLAATHDDHLPGQMAAGGMEGLVLGISVEEDKPAPKPAVWRAERKLQLIISERKAGRPLYALELHDAAQPAPRAAESTDEPLIGPPIVLRQGQPTEIEVTNRLNQSTAIHWHGIELESYFDGVPGWTGTAEQTTPAIMPGQSFFARMVPPRAGTFIYHTHWHDAAQLTNGIYGPLIVVPYEKTLDPASDKVFLFSLGTFEPFGEMLLINGHPQPTPMRLKTSVTYRFRLINIAPNNVAMRVSLRQAGTPAHWRVIAKDGADLTAAFATVKTAEMGITVGETYDVEYQAEQPQELSLEIYLPGPKLRTTQGLVFVAEPPRK
jgi:FtsP/CotA-like multicopper oxidase with cupredoxin domain